MRISDSVALGLAATLFQARAPESPLSRPAVALIREVLVAPEGDHPSTALDSRASRLARAGSGVIPGLFDLLATGILPGGAGDEPASGRQEEIAVAALARFRRGDLGRRIEPLVEPQARGGARRAGLKLLGSVGERPDLALLCDALRGPDPEADPDREEARIFQTSVASILARDEMAFPTVRSLLHAGTPAVRFHLVGALGRTGSEAALELLSAELSSRPEEVACILNEIVKLSAVVELPVDDAIPISIRLHLRSQDPGEVRASAECLGRIQDVDSVYDLVMLLGHEHPDVGHAALQALRTITGANFLADAERWRRFLLAEAEWRSVSFPRLATALEASNALEKMTALSELAAHPVYRSEIARLIESSLRAEDPPLLAAACSTLRQVGASTAVEFLEECARHGSPEVSSEARAALEAIRARRPVGTPPGGPQGPGGPDR